jgi:hypothetical protein
MTLASVGGMSRTLLVLFVSAGISVPIGAVGIAYASCAWPATVAHLELESMTIDGSASSVAAPSEVLLFRHARDHTLSGVSSDVRVEVVFVDAP